MSIKIIAGLVIALALSLFGNYKQWANEVAEDAQHAAEVRALTAEAKLSAAQLALARSEGFAAAAATETRRIDKRLEEIASSQQAVTDAYWRRLRTIPDLDISCAPGQERIDAFNDRSTE